MKALLVALLMINLVFISQAQQFSTEVWHDGFIVLAEGDTLRGKIKYNMENNAIQFQNATLIRTYSSYQVFYFNIFDQLLDVYRQFYSIPYRLKSNYETPVLFELLFEGSLSLMSRESIVQETVSTGTTLSTGTIVRDKLLRKFYFVDREGDIASFSGRKNDLYRIMNRKEVKVRSYVKDNRLRTNSVKDLVRITAFYNSI